MAAIDLQGEKNLLIAFSVKRCARILSRRERARQWEMAAAFASNVVPRPRPFPARWLATKLGEPASRNLKTNAQTRAKRIGLIRSGLWSR